MQVSAAGTLTDSYQNFIALSRYARWIDEKGRRETWTETVDRYVDFMAGYLGDKIDNDTLDRVRQAILNLEVMPSMRLLMTAGKAVERDNLANFNCSALAVDNPRAFDETLYILMNGTGLGFSVESKHTEKMPIVHDEFVNVDTVIEVRDSKRGWAEAYKKLIEHLYVGEIPQWDVSKVRPAGARLKVFGGRASGPGPLEELFKFTIEKFVKAAGRKLTPLECHDIMCMIGNIVVVGGVRRSALISLSDLDDYDMAKAKSGSWWEDNGQRALANNSAVYYEKPSVGQFLKEWKNLYDSKSGERGIVNMGGLRKHVSGFGRRNEHKVELLNPCFAADSLLLNEDGWVSFGDAYKSGVEQKIVQDGRITYVESEDGIEHPENWHITSEAERGVITQASEVFLTQENADIVKLDTASGLSVRLTPDHLVATRNGMVPAGELEPGDQVLVTAAPLTDSIVGRKPETLEEHAAFLMGMIAGDGCMTDRVAIIDLCGDDVWIKDQVLESIDSVLYDGAIVFSGLKYSVHQNGNKLRISSRPLAKYLEDYYGFTRATKHHVPGVFVKYARHAPAKFYVAALAFCDGTVNKYKKVGSDSIRINQSNRKMLIDVNKILLANGIVPKLYLRREEGYHFLPDGRRGTAEYFTKANYETVIMMHAYEYASIFGFIGGHKQDLASELFTKPSRKQNTYDTVISVVEDGIEDVYCLKEDTRRTLTAGGIAMRRCSEIGLRNMGLCNLSEVVIRPEDTLDDLRRKAEIATILGTFQSMLTDFKHVRKAWQNNAEEERLLGVSLTGVYGHRFMSGLDDFMDYLTLPEFLDDLRMHVVDTNKEWAERFGIEPSVAATTTKPSGTVSQLTGVSSGIHPWYAPYYIRTVRGDNKDPLVKMLKDQGVPWEPDVMKPDDITVFSFPIKAPESATCTSDISAVDHMELVRTYYKHWTEHSVSVTINVHEHEWLDVGAWVYDNFDDIGGMSFLPASEHTYKQAPYQAISKEEYESAVAKMPKLIMWGSLPLYELQDATTGSQELACSASGSCEQVDLAVQ